MEEEFTLVRRRKKFIGRRNKFSSDEEPSDNEPEQESESESESEDEGTEAGTAMDLGDFEDPELDTCPRMEQRWSPRYHV